VAELIGAPVTTPSLEGVFNFRDLGGLPTTDGRRTVSGAVFRSDALEELTGDDVRTLCDVVGVGRVIDLRAHIETGGGVPDWAAVEAIDFVSLPLSDDWDDWGELDDEGRRTLMARKYMSYLTAASENVVTALRLIAENAGVRPTVFHCAVGKDRSGVVAAILLSLLGVTREAIVGDYVATAPNMESIMSRLKASAIYAERVRMNPAEVYRADEHTMQLFLAALDERFGSASQWALDNGLEEAVLARLREQLVEPSDKEDT
jgi:protein-tyrosine phosphatase